MNEQALNLRSLGVPGSTRLTMSNDVGMATANVLDVVVILGPGTRLTEDFSAPIDTAKWTNSDVAFETGVGVFRRALMEANLCSLELWTN
jgi:hypothetical protein